jgi:hypothetical protein
MRYEGVAQIEMTGMIGSNDGVYKYDYESWGSMKEKNYLATLVCISL